MLASPGAHLVAVRAARAIGLDEAFFLREGEYCRRGHDIVGVGQVDAARHEAAGDDGIAVSGTLTAAHWWPERISTYHIS